MPPSLEELERRVQQDPASVAFAQLAEEYRRAGLCERAVRVARAGLTRHPGYLSARVTLGRALIELGQLDEAQAELETVLKSAPENLAAIRALADIHQRRGDAPDTTPPPTVDEPPTVEEPPTPASDIRLAPPAADPTPPAPSSEVFGTLPEPGGQEPSLDLDLQEFNGALEALDALTFELPDAEPAPIPSRPEEFDLAAFRVDAEPPDNEPGMDWTLDSFAIPVTPAVDHTPHPEAPIAAAAPDVSEREPMEVAPEPPALQPPPDPVLEELERWLGALVADRAARGRGGRS